MKKITGRNLIVLDVECESKEEVIKILAEKLNSDDRLNNMDEYVFEVLKREAVYSTAVGLKVAIPHGKCDAVKETSIAFARIRKEILWGDENVNTVFLLAIPSSEAGDKHLNILASLSRCLIHENYREKLKIAQTPEEIISLIDVC